MSVTNKKRCLMNEESRVCVCVFGGGGGGGGGGGESMRVHPYL